MIYDMVWYMIWYKIWYMIWYMIWHTIWYVIYDMIYNMIYLIIILSCVCGILYCIIRVCILPCFCFWPLGCWLNTLIHRNWIIIIIVWILSGFSGFQTVRAMTKHFFYITQLKIFDIHDLYYLSSLFLLYLCLWWLCDWKLCRPAITLTKTWIKLKWTVLLLLLLLLF